MKNVWLHQHLVHSAHVFSGLSTRRLKHRHPCLSVLQHLFFSEGPLSKIIHHLIVVECFSIWLKKARCIKELPAASRKTASIDTTVAIEVSIWTRRYTRFECPHPRPCRARQPFLNQWLHYSLYFTLGQPQQASYERHAISIEYTVCTQLPDVMLFYKEFDQVTTLLQR